MIRTEGLSFRYTQGQSALQFPDVVCESGGALLITGQSGSGKTTLLSLIGGLLKPEAGKVCIGTEDFATLSAKKLDQFRGKHIGFVLQHHYFVESISVENNLMLAQSASGNKADKNRVVELLRELNLAEKAKKRPSQLSGGERQRLGIARALVNQPAMILADEPTSSLDRKHCDEVIELLKNHTARHRASLIVVSHDERLKAEFQNQLAL